MVSVSAMIKVCPRVRGDFEISDDVIIYFRSGQEGANASAYIVGTVARGPRLSCG
jgi:hypothetical protein